MRIIVQKPKATFKATRLRKGLQSNQWRHLVVKKFPEPKCYDFLNQDA